MGRIKPGTDVEPYRAKRNERERNRVNQINKQYEVLREVIDRAESYPPRTKKLTRTEIVYEAIAIIQKLERMLGIEASSEYSLPDLFSHQSLVEPKTEPSSDPQCSSSGDYMCSSESSPPHVNEMMPSSPQPQQTLRKIGKKRKSRVQQQGVTMKRAFMATPVITGWPPFDYTKYYRSFPSHTGIPAESEVPAKMARMSSPPAPEYPTRYYEVTPSPSNPIDSPEMMPHRGNFWRVASPVSDFTKCPEVSPSPPSDAMTFVEMKPASQTDDQKDVGLLDDGHSLSGQRMEMMLRFL